MSRDTEPNEFRYTFEELPLLSDRGFSAGLVTGSAQISYWREDGYTEWFVGKIYLEGHRKATAEERATGKPWFITSDIEITQEEQPWLYLAIFGQLDGEKEWRDVIDDHVNARLEKEAA